MPLYARTPGRRAGQVLADVAVLGWVVGWLLAGRAVHGATLALAEPGRRLRDGGTQAAQRFAEAGSAARDIPLLGDRLAAPFTGAGDAADTIADAGRSQVTAVGDLALLLGVGVAVLPALAAVAVWLPLRWRFARRATAVTSLLSGGADLRLFALRALVNQPVHRLGRVARDPWRGWHDGDATVLAALASLELRDAGLAGPAAVLPAGSPSPGSPSPGSPGRPGSR